MSQVHAEFIALLRRLLATATARKAVVDADIAAREQFLADLRARADDEWWSRWTRWMTWWLGEYEWKLKEKLRLVGEIEELEGELKEAVEEEEGDRGMGGGGEIGDGGENDGSCDMEICDGGEAEADEGEEEGGEEEGWESDGSCDMDISDGEEAETGMS